jgi:hypothetical protein
MTNDDITGIHLEGEFTWEISGYKFWRFLRALPSLIPTDAVVYIEGCGISDEVRRFLLTHPAPVTTEVYRGTIEPDPEIFHITATQPVLTALAQFAENHRQSFIFSDTKASYGICDHLHVYRGNTMLIDGHDVTDIPLALSQSFDESQVADFCQLIGAQYQRTPGNAD